MGYVIICYIFVPREEPKNLNHFNLLMSDLGIPFFLNTFIVRISKRSIDYAWSGCIVKSKPSSLPHEWMKYSENHENFNAYRKVILLRHTQPVDAFSLGVESLPRNSYVPENLLKQIKKNWCNCPEPFEAALN